jgi:precorrin-6B methylase 2
MKMAYRIPEFCSAYGISRTTAYLEMSAERLRTFSVGRRRLISAEAAEAWRKLREEETSKTISRSKKKTKP